MRRPTWEMGEALGLDVYDQWAAADESGPAPRRWPTPDGDPVYPWASDLHGRTRVRLGWVWTERVTDAEGRPTRRWTGHRGGQWRIVRGWPTPKVVTYPTGLRQSLVYPCGRRVAPDPGAP